MDDILFYQGFPVKLKVSCYQVRPSLYVGLISAKDGEPYCDITAYFDIKLPQYYAAIRDYSNDGCLFTFLLKNKLGKDTGLTIPSGYAIFPIFEFSKEKLMALNPNGYLFFNEKYKLNNKVNE